MLKPLSRLHFFGLVGLILLLASVVRFYKLGEVPLGLYWDEAAMLVDAKSLAATGFDMHHKPWHQTIFISYGDFKLPLYIWLTTVVVKIGGVSEWAVRLPSAVAGVLTVAVAGALAYQLMMVKNLFKPRSQSIFKTWPPDVITAQLTALSTMAVVAVSPWSVLFSRTGFEGHVGQLLVAIGGLLLLLTPRKWWLVYVATLVGGLATYAYFSVRFVWPVVFVATLSMMAALLVNSDRNARWPTSPAELVKYVRIIAIYFLLPLILFGLCLVPMMQSPVYQDSNRFRLGTKSILEMGPPTLTSNIYREMAGNTSLDRLAFNRYWLVTQELLVNYSEHLSLTYLFLTGDPNLRHGTGAHGLFLPILLPCLLIGFWHLGDKHKLVLVVLGMWWLIALLPASVPENTPHALRSLNALVPLSIIMGVGFATGLQWASRLGRHFYKRTSWPTVLWWPVAAMIAILALSAATFIYHYFTYYPSDSARDWQYGYKQVAQQLFAMREMSPVYISVFDDRFYLWLLIYGPYAGQDYQDWPTHGYVFKDFDDIIRHDFSGWEGVPHLDTRSTVVGSPERLQPILTRPDVRVVKREVIYLPSGEAVYVVALIDKKL